MAGAAAHGASAQRAELCHLAGAQQSQPQAADFAGPALAEGPPSLPSSRRVIQPIATSSILCQQLTRITELRAQRATKIINIPPSN